MKNKMSTTEGWYNLPPINHERYGERAGLEGPFQTKAGKVVYYDPREGEYYDPDTDMYLSREDWHALNEELPPHLAKFVDKDGDWTPETKHRLGKDGVGRLSNSKKKSTDVTPHGYGPEVNEKRIGQMSRKSVRESPGDGLNVLLRNTENGEWHIAQIVQGYHPRYLRKQIDQLIHRLGWETRPEEVAQWQGDLDQVLANAQEKLSSGKNFIPSYENELKKTVYDLTRAKKAMNAGEEVNPVNIESQDIDQVIKDFLHQVDQREVHENKPTDSDYAIGMAQAKKSRGDSPPLEKSTIRKAHEIAKAVAKESAQTGQRMPTHKIMQRIEMALPQLEPYGVKEKVLGIISDILYKADQGLLEDDDPCWKGYRQLGMKKKNGKEVPNCVPESDSGISETIRVSTNRYQRAHGTKPRGSGGQWIFTSKEYGDIDLDDNTTVFRAPWGLPLTKATAHAKKWARDHSYREVYVAEGKSSDGYQNWPGEKKKKFYQAPRDEDGKTDTQKWAEKRRAERDAAKKKVDEGMPSFGKEAKIKVDGNVVNTIKIQSGKMHQIAQELRRTNIGLRDIDITNAARELSRGKSFRKGNVEISLNEFKPRQYGEKTESVSYERGMDNNSPIVIKGVKGMNSKPFRKKFRNQAAFDRWMDSDAADDYEVHQVMNEFMNPDDYRKSKPAGITPRKIKPSSDSNKNPYSSRREAVAAYEKMKRAGEEPTIRQLRHLRDWGVKTISEKAISKIACLKCDEVSSAAAWGKNNGFCPKCKTSSQGVAEQVNEKEGGMSDAERKAYNRKHGSNLKRAQPSGGKRRTSYCARSKGQMDQHNIDCRKDNDKPICKARRDWNC